MEELNAAWDRELYNLQEYLFPSEGHQGKSITLLCIRVTEMYFYALKYGLLISASICSCLKMIAFNFHLDGIISDFC